jgi:hypothetical protein
LAAADAAEGGPPPKELKWAWRTKAWGSPVAGGWLEWPAGMSDRMTVCQNVYNAILESGRQKNLAQWADSNPQQFEIVAMVQRLRNDRATTDGN